MATSPVQQSVSPKGRVILPAIPKASELPSPVPPPVSLVEIRQDEFSDIAFDADNNANESQIQRLRALIDSEQHVENEQFYKDAQKEVVKIDKLDLLDAKKEEVVMEEQRIVSLQASLERNRNIAEECMQAELSAKQSLEPMRKQLAEELQRINVSIGNAKELSTNQQQTTFRRVEDQLREFLRKKGASLSVSTLKLFDPEHKHPELYDIIQSRRFSLLWDHEPRMLRIRVNFIRCLSSKLPPGEYKVMCTIFDRMGGRPMRWSKSLDKSVHGKNILSGATPVAKVYQGQFNELELCFGERANRLFIPCPSVHDSDPSMCLIFELLLIHDDQNKVMAWGSFPLVQSSLDLIEGNFKVALMRGQINRSIDKYSGIEERISSDLDTWLGNLYFHVRHMPCSTNRQQRYCVDLNWNISRMPPLAAEEKLGEVKVKLHALPSIVGASQSTGELLTSLNSKSVYDVADAAEDDSEHKGDAVRHEDYSRIEVQLRLIDNLGHSAVVDKVEKIPATAYHDDDDDPPAFKLKWLDVEQMDDIDVDMAFNNSEGPYSRSKASLEKYKQSVRVEEVDENALPRSKLKYIINVVTYDLHWKKWRSSWYWLALLILFSTWWIRIYPHYIGQWLYLRTAKVPVETFSFGIMWMDVIYPVQPSAITDISVIAVGHATNMLIFLLLMITAAVHQKCLGTFPWFASQFMLSYGFGTLLDPLLILFIDACRKNYPNGDLMKLYYFYSVSEGSGGSGVLLSIILVAAGSFISLCLVYTYITYLHHNGRISDIYRRLYGAEELFFMPQDAELSARALRWILVQAKLGITGKKQRIVVTRYQVQDNADPSKFDETIHLALYDLAVVNGEETLYRHFVSLPNGCICELFESSDTSTATRRIVFAGNLKNTVELSRRVAPSLQI